MLRIADSEWSDAFPVDVVGSTGRIKCKTANGRSYEVNTVLYLNISSNFSSGCRIDSNDKFGPDKAVHVYTILFD
jgi:hypothetical protein